MQIAIGIILIIAALFLVVAVLMQHGKDHNLSGTIAGGAETFFGKSKASTLDKKLSKLTSIVAVVFTLLVLICYLMQDTVDLSTVSGGANLGGNTADTTDTADTTEDTAGESAASDTDIAAE